MERLRQAAKRFSEFFNRLNRGPTAGAGAGSPGLAGGSGSREDMFTRRVANGDTSKGDNGRRIRPEEHGLTAEGLPRTQWDNGNGYHPGMSESRDRPMPDHIPRPPVPVTVNKVEIPAAASKENEIRTVGIPTPGTSSDSNRKQGKSIHVTDQ